MSFIRSDAVGTVLHTAINGFALRQEVLADNIANVDTPDFRAASVEFEGALAAAINAGRYDDEETAPQLSATITPTTTPVGVNGNNVDLRNETMAAIQTQFQYQIMGRAISDRHSILRTVAGAM